MRRMSWGVSAGFLSLAVLLLAPSSLEARPRYRQVLKKRYGDLLPKRLDACAACHRADGSASEEKIDPAASRMPPHNVFGARLRALGEELRASGKDAEILARLRIAAAEDADGDGVPSGVEILAGTFPGDAADVPEPSAARAASEAERRILAEDPWHPWTPFRPVERPAVPEVASATWLRNPIDAFIAREHEARGLRPRPEAPRTALLRRVSLDLTGLPPTPAELAAFLEDPAPDAYERAVDRLLASAAHGERWGRHWMDVWRYSDWAGWGNQIRDSQPHIWRWRDWIVESLNADRPYDRMVLEMLAADEIAPGDPDTLRATGYLARSFKLLSREAWMQEAVDHAAQAFLGVSLGCARCHDHMYDPISQEEYYRVRAVFEPYQVRLDRLPGQPDTAKDGLARIFDAQPDAKTYLFIRGDDRRPDKERPLSPGAPAALGGGDLRAEPVSLPLAAWSPDRREFAVAEDVEASRKAVEEAKGKFRAALLEAAKAGKAADEAARVKEMAAVLAEARHAALEATVRAERMEESGAKEKDPAAWTKAAEEALAAQRWRGLLEARHGEAASALALETARAALATAREAASKVPAESPEAKKAAEALKKAEGEAKAAEGKLDEARKALAKASEESAKPLSIEFARRDLKSYPRTSSGRRLAFARWLVDRKNPLAARVAANHIWMRHIGQAIVPSTADFGLNGRPPSHPALLDWLAAELMEPTATPGAAPWSMKALHRLIVTSATYRMDSLPDPANAGRDPDNRWLWRMGSRRLEAEAVRDAVLSVSGLLDPARGGPELDQGSVLSTRRRSIYYRHAAEKSPEFLQVFDMAGVSECYERKVSVVPQQALALANSSLVLEASRALARKLAADTSEPRAFVEAAFRAVLSRDPRAEEIEECLRYLSGEDARWRGASGTLTSASPGQDLSKPSPDPALRAREGLAHVLLNHHELVTVR